MFTGWLRTSHYARPLCLLEGEGSLRCICLKNKLKNMFTDEPGVCAIHISTGGPRVCAIHMFTGGHGVYAIHICLLTVLGSV